MHVLAEYIMAEFLLSSETRNTMAAGLSEPHGMASISIHGSPVHSKITQSIAYENSKFHLLQHWDNRHLTHTEDWDEIYLTLLKQAWEMTTVHMAHFIKKYISNTLPTMPILQRQVNATINIYPRCGVTP